MTQYKIYQGNCLDELSFFMDNSVDSIVTDPPYGLSFMGKRWDYEVPQADVWRECLRVLKPGGHLLSFFGTRTYHRGVVQIEDAGFEVRDQIAWVYGSGFPKSHNGEWGGTALKPAWEPVCVARKPLIGTVEVNWSQWGTGALNIDRCRVETTENPNGGAYAQNATERSELWGADAGNSWVRGGAGEFVQPKGRWPANLIHDGSEEVLATFPQAQGQQGQTGKRKQGVVYNAVDEGESGIQPRGDTGSAARFFYCAKASKRDRDEGLDLQADRILARSCQAQAEAKRGNVVSEEGGAFNKARIRKNNHPTVKPTDLMRYLCRLVTPSGGVVLDPFMGSGSTGKAALLEGFRFIGIEREAEYLQIARARIQAVVQDDDL